MLTTPFDGNRKRNNIWIGGGPIQPYEPKKPRVNADGVNKRHESHRPVAEVAESYGPCLDCNRVDTLGDGLCYKCYMEVPSWYIDKGLDAADIPRATVDATVMDVEVRYYLRPSWESLKEDKGWNGPVKCSRIDVVAEMLPVWKHFCSALRDAAKEMGYDILFIYRRNVFLVRQG